ncbi:MAG: NADPH:quinone reductase [Desulfuromonadales bacterium]|nr:NADPH:quinone reductase [Desulfuromonadales bacterium]
MSIKSIRIHTFGGPEVIQFETVPRQQPAADQVLVKIKAVGVNPVDTYIRAGAHAVKPILPYTPGFDAAGIIEEIGPGVKKFQEGQRVFLIGSITGTYAEYALCNLNQVYPLPDRITFSQGAAIGIPYATAYYALMYRAHTMPGETLLIHGASGAVGIAATQLARAAGIHVIGTAGSDAGKILVSETGAEHVLDHSLPDYLDEVMELTGHEGVNVILEMLANVNLGKDLKILSKQGRVVVIGCRGEASINPRDIMGREAAILGMSLFNANDRQKAQIFAAVCAGLNNGTLTPVVGKEFSLAEAAQAHQYVLQAGAYGKVVLRVP